MASEDVLIERIRSEYREMPGLRLTHPQACRLWQVDAALCEAALDRLVHESFLHRTRDGAYVALPSQQRQAKAGLPRNVSPRKAR